jgi:hypothetical protein
MLDPSETRQMGERDRAKTEQIHISGRAFWIALAAVVVVVLLFALLRR